MTPNQLPPLPVCTHCVPYPGAKEDFLYTADQMHAYALAALAQQAQPVAWVCKSGHGTVFRESITPELASLEHGGRKVWTPLYTTPPAPQPAPVDEREAWLPIEADTVPDRSKPLFWLLVDGSPVLGYFVEIPFREIRDADGRYIDQQDADVFWATQATGDQVEPTHYCELMPPTAPQTKGGGA